MRKFAIAGNRRCLPSPPRPRSMPSIAGFMITMAHARMSAEDRAAMADAKIAAVHAGLKLTADQEKLWPPVESAVRDLVKIRIDRAKAREAAEARPRADDQPASPIR